MTINQSRRVALGALVLLAAAFVIAACGGSQPVRDAAAPTATVIDPTDTVEPVYRYNQVLSRDAILPIYAPEFVHADEAQIKDEELVLAIAIGGEAKAYPITVLNSREMVNDELAGIPILATW